VTESTTRRCTDMHCIAQGQENHLMRRMLTPAMQPGASPVDALMYVIDQARQAQRSRDAYRDALNRVATLYLQGEQHGGVVRTDALCRAMFVSDEVRT
jgi:hypothetical protein